MTVCIPPFQSVVEPNSNFNFNSSWFCPVLDWVMLTKYLKMSCEFNRLSHWIYQSRFKSRHESVLFLSLAWKSLMTGKIFYRVSTFHGPLLSFIYLRYFKTQASAVIGLRIRRLHRLWRRQHLHRKKTGCPGNHTKLHLVVMLQIGCFVLRCINPFKGVSSWCNA